MTVSDELLCLFSAEIEQRNGSFVVEIPEGEIALGGIAPGEPFRVALFPAASPRTGSDPGPVTTEDGERDGTERVPEPPVEGGDVQEVEIEDVGDQGDGIARIDRGYVVIVPGTSVGDRVTIEVTDVRQNFAFGEPINGRR